LRRSGTDIGGGTFAVVHEASSIEDALPFIEALQPAVVLVDLPASREAAAAGISRIREIALRSRIVVLTETIRLAQLADGLLGGIDGYLLKNISADALPQSLRLVLLGEKVFPTDLAQLLTDGRNWRGERRQIEHANGLSDREVEILGWLVNGAQNKRIAQALIGVQNRTQAAIWALDHGFAKDTGAVKDIGAEPPRPAPGKRAG
jgi:two-component system, NarL family, nitrate/nitrite response regulator NarL